MRDLPLLSGLHRISIDSGDAIENTGKSRQYKGLIVSRVVRMGREGS